MDVSRLPRADRLALARLQGAAHRLGRGRRDIGEPDDPVAALRAITTDPKLLGLAAAALAGGPDPQPRAVALLEEAGADQAVAAEHAAWLAERRRRTGGI